MASFWDRVYYAFRDGKKLPEEVIPIAICDAYGWTQRQIEDDFEANFWDGLLMLRAKRIEAEQAASKKADRTSKLKKVFGRH